MFINKYVEIYFNSIAKVSKSKKPEAPKYGLFGEYAWAPHREGMPFEDDNTIEKIVYKDLQKHFGDHNNNRKGLPATTAELLRLLLIKGWYKPVLHPPPVKTLYRGLTLNKNDLSKYLGLDCAELDLVNNIDFEDGINIQPKQGHSTSWSFKKKITKDFSEQKHKKNDMYSVTLFADIKDNPYRFLAGPGGLYDVRGLSMYHLEKETVGLEPIKIRRIEWKKLK